MSELGAITVEVKIKRAWRTAFAAWLLRRQLKRLRIYMEGGK